MSREGTGLGLAITRQFVELMGGTIEVESKPDHGSLFRFTLSVQAAKGNVTFTQPSAEMRHVVGLAQDKPEHRILIVEDIPDNQLLLLSILEFVGLDVRIAENGEEAITLFKEWQPHFIWMDRRMPVMGGLEATRRIRELPGEKEVIIVAITASVFSDQKNEVLAAGSDDFVHKPYRSEDIYNCLTKYLGLDYRYAEEPEERKEDLQPHTTDTDTDTISSTALGELPEELLSELRNAALTLDMERALTTIKQIKETAPVLAAALQQQIENLDFQTLQQQLKQV